MSNKQIPVRSLVVFPHEIVHLLIGEWYAPFGFSHYPPATMKKGYSLFPQSRQGFKILPDKVRQHSKVITAQGYIFT